MSSSAIPGRSARSPTRCGSRSSSGSVSTARRPRPRSERRSASAPRRRRTTCARSRRFGLVVDAGGGTGRNRPWQAAGTGFMFEPAEHVGPGAQAAVQLLSAQLIARGEQETLAFVAGESSLDPDWRNASHIANATLNLTAERGGRGRQADRRRPRAVPAERAHRRPDGRRARAAAAAPLPPRAAGARREAANAALRPPRGQRDLDHGQPPDAARDPVVRAPVDRERCPDRPRRLLLAPAVRDLVRPRRRDRRPARVPPGEHRLRPRERRRRARRPDPLPHGRPAARRAAGARLRRRAARRARARRRARRCCPSCSSGPR